MDAFSLIPKYPHFVNLTLEHQKEITDYTSKFPFYSDYDFAVMWWSNTNNDFEVSNLNGNLVVLFKNYVTDHPVYSFLGTNKVVDTIQTLIARSKEKGYCDFLKNVPEVSLKRFKNSEHFQIEEDIDQFDYIFATEDLMNLPGRKYRHKRQIVERFLQNHPDASIKITRTPSQRDIQQILEISKKWKGECLEKHEVFLCIQRLLSYRDRFSLEVASVHAMNRMLGFQIYELVGANALAHFRNCDPEFQDAASFLTKEHAAHLYKNGCILINRMQDLGMPNLRQAKTLWRPRQFLKKYTVYERQ